jgi:hypothetical protein
MKDKMKTETNISVNVSGTLFLIFLVLKLCKVIDWSWWWVTSPLWIPFAILFIAGVLYAIMSD